ncbi:hypothetical protein [Methyloversatilis sp. XJ19-49]|uniref:hypothetical protein n=1 Tax=Methyloversatilis sp. XJ19-49 TaxID=2963429 RepID=UPI00211CA9F6|nr:hypothetical protein [Methyloversatilis sp. XJ19-49]MCQ9377673.1 hypothetical protein [Methyloversatilis sp. XJ19-49]
MKQHDAHLSQFSIAVGIAALVAPALHSATDALEWYYGGFSVAQLWLNYIAFLPMPWLLLGLYAVRKPRPNVVGLIGALLYGAAFTYFAHTTLYAMAEKIPTYEALWARLGSIYTVHGAFMVLGGFMFAWSALRAGWLPKWPLLLFAAGVALNLLLALIPAPDILQTIGTAARNLGLVAMGYAILFRQLKPAA